MAFSDSLSIQIGWIFIVVWKLKIRDLGTMCRPIRLRWRNDLPIKQEICVIWIGDGCIDFTVVVLQPCSIKHVHRTYDLCQSCSVCRIDRGPKRYPNWGPNWGTQCFAPTQQSCRARSHIERSRVVPGVVQEGCRAGSRVQESCPGVVSRQESYPGGVVSRQESNPGEVVPRQERMCCAGSRIVPGVVLRRSRSCQEAYPGEDVSWNEIGKK